MNLTATGRRDLIAQPAMAKTHTANIAVFTDKPPGPASLAGRRSFELRDARVNAVTPGWFATYGTQLLAGDSHVEPTVPGVELYGDRSLRSVLASPNLSARRRKPQVCSNCSPTKTVF